MIANQAHLYEALLRWNYFPNQKKGHSELPPIFQTRQFTPDIAEIIATENHRKSLNGYGLVEYRSTRFNNIPRTLGLVHPYAHAKLVKHLIDNWSEYHYIYFNDKSAVKPETYSDGRAFIMSYEEYDIKVSKSLKNSFGKNFRAHTDISNCFNSVYTHSVEWAIRGLEEVKQEREYKGNTYHWAKKLDTLLSQTKRKETHGIPIGPGTSSIIIEIILARVDKILTYKNYEFTRYVDDYTCLCETHSEAQAFISDLGNELSKYRLSLSLTKTAIVEQPEPLQPAWVSNLTGAKPATTIDKEANSSKLFLSEIIHYLDHAVRLNKETPDGSVLKFAISSIIRNIGIDDKMTIANYITNLAWHYPILLPFIDDMEINEEQFSGSDLPEKLIKIAEYNAEHRRSDGIAWPLYYLLKNGVDIPQTLAEKTIESKDCISICLLSLDQATLHHAVNFAKSLDNYNDYIKDEHWLLLYQLYFRENIENPYPSDNTFDILKTHNVNFMPEKNGKNSAEDYIELKNMGFIENPSYDHFLTHGTIISQDDI